MGDLYGGYMTIFSGKGIIWDAEKDKVLCRFENSRYETEDKREIEILTGFDGVVLVGEDAVFEEVKEPVKRKRRTKAEMEEETLLNEKEIDSIEEEA